MNEIEVIDDIVGRLRGAFGAAPDVGVVLGSGMGPFAGALSDAVRVPASELGLPRAVVAGHAGEVVVGTTAGGRRVACFAGRVHAYEGYAGPELVRYVRAFRRWGGRGLVLTSAVGGLHADWPTGTVVVLRDHLNLLGVNPLRGPNLDAIGTRFPDLARLYTPARRHLAVAVAADLGLPALREGVYGAMPGPSYETPAEIAMLRILGADVVGMSVVPEAIAAGHAGLELLALAVVANPAAGLTTEELTHADVTRAMAEAGTRVVQLLRGVVEQW